MKIGFIDYYLDEWHANHYPGWFKGADPDMEVTYAYAMIDNPNGLTTDEWCRSYNVNRCTTIEEIVEKSDVLTVLSPDNCELHEALSQVALRSGKRVYIDKTFAPNADIGKKIFNLANAHGTPCFSTSALRFAQEYREIDKSAITGIVSLGGNSLETYSIHQLEPVIMLMQTPVHRIMGVSNEDLYTLTLEFTDGRLAIINGFIQGYPFVLNLAMKDGSSRLVEPKEDFFHAFIQEVVRFYKTGERPVSQEETLRIAAARAAAVKALASPGRWINVGIF